MVNESDQNIRRRLNEMVTIKIESKLEVDKGIISIVIIRVEFETSNTQSKFMPTRPPWVRLPLINRMKTPL